MKSVYIGSTLKMCALSFINCAELESIVVSPENNNFDSRDNCNAIITKSSNELVVGCYTTVIPLTVKRIRDDAFVGRTKLSSLTIPANVWTIGKAFQGCDNLRTLHYEAKGSICNTYAIYEIFVEDPETGELFYHQIGETPFLHSGDGYSVIQLDSVTFGPEVQVIPDYLLWGQQNIKRIELPATVVSIGENAFGNSGIEEIVIPENVLKVGKSAFSKAKLNNVYCLSTDPDIAEVTTSGGTTYTPFDAIPESCVLHVPQGKKEAFEQHPGWQGFKHVVEIALEPADVNSDFVIDIIDVNEVINAMLGKGSASLTDVTGDGKVDIADINAVINAMLGK